MITKDKLIENLANYGYPLLQPLKSPPEEILQSLLEQDDFRFLEGFPVVFCDALKKKPVLKWERPEWYPNDFSKEAMRRFPYLLALSYLLLKTYPLRNCDPARAMNILLKFPDPKKILAQVRSAYLKSASVRAGKDEFSTQRFKETFQTYAVEKEQDKRDEELERQRSALEFEMRVSEIFTPRQKMLLRKKHDKRPFTKTEREYFSRVLKKRLKALADPRLHDWARSLL